MRAPSLLIYTLMALCVVGMASSSFAAITEVIISAETIKNFGETSAQNTAFVPDTNASNGLAFQFIGGANNPPVAEPTAWWEVEFWCEAGTYYIWARGKSDGDVGTESFWLQFDNQIGTLEHTADPDFLGRGLGNWRDVYDAGIYKWVSQGTPPQTVVEWTAKESGLHRVRAQPRQSPHFLDQLLISQHQDERPFDEPWPTEFPRKDPHTVESNDGQLPAHSGVGYAFSKTPIYLDDTFTLDIRAEDVFDLAGWQFDIAFDPAVLEAIDVTEGDFLKMHSTITFFLDGSIDNANGKITGLSAVRFSSGGVSGTGSLLQVTFKAKSAGETQLALQNFQFGAITGEVIPAGPHEVHITMEEQPATRDVNRDGRVSILDIILIAEQLGRRVPANSPVDLNRDGIVSILDLILAAQAIGRITTPAAPTVEAESVDPARIKAWIAQARLEDDGSLAFKEGVENLQNLIASLIPEESALHRNYPNPFNPETWIPYQLAESTEVALTIYDMNGQLVRRLALGHQAAGVYRSRSRAVYWDGRNQLGESVASGLYFYTLTAGEFTATRRMLILK